MALLRENSGHLRALRDMLKLQAWPVVTRGLSRFRVIKLKATAPFDRPAEDVIFGKWFQDLAESTCGNEVECPHPIA